ncbi:MAG: sulfatase family protein [Pseudomonadales bacterium]
MKRLRILALLFTLLIAACAFGNARIDNVQDSSPNIVIILADDMGFGDIGANGATKIKTPNIDAIAAAGVNLTQFHASANICTPSRAGLMTGRYPIRTGLGYDVVRASDKHGLPVEEETLADLAKRAGYTTMLIGKWHLGEFPQHLPLKHGFDFFYGVPHSNDMPNFALYRSEKKIEQPVDQASLTARYTKEAVQFIRKYSQQSFLLFVSHTMPHIPLYTSEQFAGQSDAGLYGDVIEELDASVGTIVKALRDQGLYENTLIIVTSDNGPFFEGGVAGLKGGKGSGWEGAYRVPLVASWPQGLSARGSLAAMTMNIDILPTVADVLGVVPDGNPVDGRSLLPMFRGERESTHQYLYFFNNEELIGLRTQRWKFLTHTYYRRSLGAFEKFDQLDGFQSSYDLLFEAGPAGGEQYSYANRYPKIVTQMKAELATARARFAPFRTRPPDKTFPE